MPKCGSHHLISRAALYFARGVVVVAALCALQACVRAGFSEQGVALDLGPDLGPDQGPEAALDLGPARLALCAELPDADVLALFLFGGSGTTLDNTVVGGPVGSLMGAGAQRVAGPVRCGGSALQFPMSVLEVCGGCDVGGGFCATDPAHGVLPASLGANLDSGSVDLWVRFDGVPHSNHPQGILSRDAQHELDPGHFTLHRLLDGSIGVRIQDGLDMSDEPFICSAPVPEDEWHHVLVNFGPEGLQLQVDGQWVAVPKTVGTTLCVSDSPVSVGIAGNAEPWLVGASSVFSCTGTALPATTPVPGTIARLRISRVRRDFSVDFGE
ncbi:MAG: hypothetical protein JRH20_00950 [Deltaproteobacteria bacterium]|nr:hypothetical protein [Deltaproteobacteria bacterium]